MTMTDTVAAPGLRPAQLRRVPANTPAEEICAIVEEDGSVVIEGVFSKDQIDRVNAEFDPHLEATVAGAIAPAHLRETLAPGQRVTQGGKFEWGRNTKQVHDLIPRSKTYREEILEADIFTSICDVVYAKDPFSYWLIDSEIIEVGPGSTPQTLHRDLDRYYPFIDMGPAGPEVTSTFILPLVDFTAENGGTRMIPGSHKWPDYHDRGSQDMTIAVEAKAGDLLYFTGKVVHGSGGNTSAAAYRRALSFGFQPGFLTPKATFPFALDHELARTLSPRLQRMLGFPLTDEAHA